MRERVEQQVENSTDIADRLEQLELPPSGIELEDDQDEPETTESVLDEAADIADISKTPTTETGEGFRKAPKDAVLAAELRSVHLDEQSSTSHDLALPVQASFDITLSKTRVYNRVRGREVDTASMILTSRSHAWSVFSDLSLSQLSVIAV